MPALTFVYGGNKCKVEFQAKACMGEIIFDFCKETGVSTALSLGVLHRGKMIPATMPFHLTGLANNATIELTVSNEKVVSNGGVVKVCLQLPSGFGFPVARLIVSVPASVTLLELLEFAEKSETLQKVGLIERSSEDGQVYHPVLIDLQREVLLLDVFAR